jgi:hypothetical protein
MKRLVGIIFVLSLGLLSLQSAKESSAQNGAQQPELIGEGTVSTPDDELAGNITADGTTLYFEGSAPPHYLYILYESHVVKGKWQKPTVLPFSGQYKDTDPVLSPDDQTLLRVGSARGGRRPPSLLHLVSKENSIRLGRATAFTRPGK